MANPLIFNPLLKKGLQELNDTSTINAAIDTLRQRKITKVLNGSQLAELTNGEIFQWQGEDTTIDETDFKKGFFYTTGGNITIPEGTNYIDIPEDIVGEFSTINQGRYYNTGVQSVIQLSHRSSIFDYVTYRLIHLGGEADLPRVGDTIIKQAATYSENSIYYKITAVSWVSGNMYNLTLDNGNTLTLNFTTGGNYYYLQEFSNNDSKVYLYNFQTFTSFSPVLFADIENGNAPIFAPYIDYGTTDSEIIITAGYTQVNTQPGIAGISNNPSGGVDIDTDVAIAGNLTVQGTQTTVHMQEIDSESDNINLRVNNPLGLKNGVESGIKVLNYDGNTTNCFLGVDNQGWARVGDEGGTLQKLATIEDTPTDGEFVAYNTTSKQLESKTIPETSKTAAGLCPALPNESTTTKYLRQDGTWQVPPYPSLATTSAAGLMSASDKTKLDGINFTVSTQTFRVGSNKVICYKYGRIVFVKFSLISSTSISIGADYQPIEDLYGIGHSNNSVNPKVQIVNGALSLPTNDGTAQGTVCYISKT